MNKKITIQLILLISLIILSIGLYNKYFSDQFSCPSKYDIEINYSDDIFSETKFDEKNVFDLLRKMDANVSS